MTVQDLAKFITHAPVPQGVLECGIGPVADCFGCMLAGADAEVTQTIRAVQSRHSGGATPLYGTNIMLTGPAAALVNGVAAHAWDLDDWEEPGNTHPTAVILPALLAAAAMEAESGRRFSGEDLLTAYAIGTELIMRLGETVSLDHYARGFHSTATLGAVGAAAATARLLSLTEDETAHALGLSVSGASGYTMQFGTHAKSMQAGLAARGGLEAALHARHGVKANPETLLDARGFAGLMGAYDLSAQQQMTKDLGQRWGLESWGIVLKPWPSCGYTHRMMTAALDLRAQLGSRINDITKIMAKTIDFHYAILPFHQPGSQLEALFSLPACTAQMLCHGQLTLADSNRGFWQDETVSQLVDLTEVTTETVRKPELNYDPDQPDRLCIGLADGQVLETAVAYPLGAPQRPMSREQMATKYSDITARPGAEFHQLIGFDSSDDINLFFREFGQ